MDGGKGTVRYSLQRRLQAGVAIIIASTALLGSSVAYWAALHEAHELQDGVLQQMARLTPSGMPSSATLQESSVPANVVEARLHVEAPLYVGVLDTAGNVRATSMSIPPLVFAQTLHAGLQNVNASDKPYRVYVQPRADGKAIVVAQETAIRDDIARSSALGALLPYVLITPVVLVLVAGLIRRVFLPVTRLVEDIENRTDTELHALDDAALPQELAPFTGAINRLLQRVGRAVSEQQRFIADAAHELRTPLTALSLQAEQLTDPAQKSTWAERAEKLQTGIFRTRHLLEQLLDMARARTTSQAVTDVISSQALFRAVLEQHMATAQAKALDIGIVTGSDQHWRGNRADWHLLVSNLVSNAVVYTQPGGRVDLSTVESDGKIVLMVEDSGPGIAADDRERVMNPFVRGHSGDAAGSGLGLSIVQAIAEKYSATVKLEASDPTTQKGLRVRVFLPTNALNVQGD